MNRAGVCSQEQRPARCILRAVRVSFDSLESRMIEIAVAAVTSLAAISGLIWAVYTWNERRTEEIATERNRVAALYVNPFMMACEDLQSRIYGLLHPEKYRLKSLCDRYPKDGSKEVALQTLHMTRREICYREA